MVSKEEQNLIWKYFWQQKFTEISVFIIIISAFIFIPYLLGSSIGNNAVCVEYYESSWTGVAVDEESGPFSEVSSEECKKLGGHLEYFGEKIMWLEGFSYIILLFPMMMIALWYLVLEDWILSNWRKAKRRARSDIKRNKVKKKKNEAKTKNK